MVLPHCGTGCNTVRHRPQNPKKGAIKPLTRNDLQRRHRPSQLDCDKGLALVGQATGHASGFPDGIIVAGTAGCVDVEVLSVGDGCLAGAFLDCDAETGSAAQLDGASYTPLSEPTRFAVICMHGVNQQGACMHSIETANTANVASLTLRHAEVLKALPGAKSAPNKYTRRTH